MFYECCFWQNVTADTVKLSWWFSSHPSALRRSCTWPFWPAVIDTSASWKHLGIMAPRAMKMKIASEKLFNPQALAQPTRSVSDWALSCQCSNEILSDLSPLVMSDLKLENCVLLIVSVIFGHRSRTSAFCWETNRRLELMYSTVSSFLSLIFILLYAGAHFLFVMSHILGCHIQ